MGSVAGCYLMLFCRMMWRICGLEVRFFKRLLGEGAYQILTAVDTINPSYNNHILWLKAVSLKVSLFVWLLILYRLSTTDNMFRRGFLITTTKLVQEGV